MEFTHFTVTSNFEISIKRDTLVLSQSCKKDKYYIKNVLNDNIVSDEWYPIISLTDDVKDSQYPRSLDILLRLSSNCVTEPLNQQFINNHSAKIKLNIRDLYLITLTDREWLDNCSIINGNKVTDIFGNTFFSHDDAIWIDNVPMCFYPCKNFNVLRFVDKDSICDTRFAIYNNKRIVFLRRCDISYYNFENIISVDLPDFEEPVYDFREVKKDDVFTFSIDKNVLNALLMLDKKNYYVPPLNNDERGGKRFVFTSNNLATYLFTQLYEKLANSKFRKVNSVFRYNKFQAQDKFFKNHFDIPYVDKTNKEFSLYTLIIYLQVSETEEALILQNQSYKFQDGQCILFKQNNDHTGLTFTSKEKIFLRTDLIFRLNKVKVRHESNYLSYLFNEACYLSLKSFHDREFQKYATETFNHYNNVLHNKIYQRKKYKYFKYRSLKQPLSYLTNGNFYIFRWDSSKNPNKENLLPYVRAILEDYFTNDPVYVDCIDSNCYVDNFDSAEELLKEEINLRCRHISDKTVINHVCSLDDESDDHGLYCNCVFGKFDPHHYDFCDCYPPYLKDVICCKRCCGVLEEKFDVKRSQRYLLATDVSIIDSQFDFSNMRVIGDKIYFRNKRNFHYAQALYCDCDCDDLRYSSESSSSDDEDFPANRIVKVDHLDFPAKRIEKSLKKVVNTFISYHLLNDSIVFLFDLFKNNVTFEEMVKDVYTLD